MADADIRWRQRFDNFERALQVLERGVELAGQRALSELEQQGLIQGFTFTHELAWNLLKDYLQHQGIEGIIGSRDATRLAFQNGLISAGHRPAGHGPRGHSAGARHLPRGGIRDPLWLTALGRHRPASDIDLTLIGPDISSSSMARMDADLDELLLP